MMKDDERARDNSQCICFTEDIQGLKIPFLTSFLTPDKSGNLRFSRQCMTILQYTTQD